MMNAINMIFQFVRFFLGKNTYKSRLIINGDQFKSACLKNKLTECKKETQHTHKLINCAEICCNAQEHFTRIRLDTLRIQKKDVNGFFESRC